MEIIKYLKFIVPGFFFFMVMDFFAKNINFSYHAFIALVILVSLSSFQITRYRFLPIVLAWIFIAGSVLFLFTLGKSGLQYLYVLTVSLLFVILLIGLERFFIRQEDSSAAKNTESRILDSGFNLNQSIVFASVFLISAGIYGIYIDLDLPTWKMMVVVFVSIFFATSYLTEVNFLKSKVLGLHLDMFKNKTFVFYSFLSGFLMAEVIWAMTFLPVNHLTIGAIVLSLYYPFWNILKSHLRNELTYGVVVSNLMFFIITAGIVLAAGKWDIA